MPHAILGFNGWTEHTIYNYVGFGDKTSRSVSARLSEIGADEANRDGLAIAAAGKLLRSQRAPYKLMLVISDGQPSAAGYDGPEAIRDTSRSVADLVRAGVSVFCLYVGEAYDNHVEQIYPGGA